MLKDERESLEPCHQLRSRRQQRGEVARGRVMCMRASPGVECGVSGNSRAMSDTIEQQREQSASEATRNRYAFVYRAVRACTVMTDDEAIRSKQGSCDGRRSSARLLM